MFYNLMYFISHCIVHIITKRSLYCVYSGKMKRLFFTQSLYVHKYIRVDKLFQHKYFSGKVTFYLYERIFFQIFISFFTQTTIIENLWGVCLESILGLKN